MSRLLLSIRCAVVWCFVSIDVSAQPADSVAVLIELRTEITGMRNELAHTRARLDLLDQAIDHAQETSAMWSAALDEQATRFALIVTAVLALFGFVSYAGFRGEVSRIERTTQEAIAEQADRFEEFETRVRETEGRLLSSYGNTFRITANHYASQGRFHRAFQHDIMAAGFHAQRYALGRATEEAATKSRRVIRTNLTHARNRLSDVKRDAASRKNFKNVYREVQEHLLNLQTIRDEDIQNLCAEIRVGLKELVPDEG